MGNIYDVNAAIQKPNIVNAMREGFVFGTQQRQMREDEQRQNQLRTLTPAAADGDMAAQDQMLALDPQRAGVVRQASDDRLRKLQGFIKYVDRARATGNVNAVNAALRQGAPFLSQITGGQPPPTEWTPDMDAGWEQLKAKVSMGGEPAAGPGGKVVGNALVDPTTGQVIYQGPDVPANAQIVKIPDGRGGLQDYMFDPRTRQVMELPRPGSAPQGAPAGRAPQGFATAQDEQGQPDPTLAALPETEQIKASQLAAAGRPFHVQGGRVVEGESGGLRQPANNPAQIPIGRYGGGDERMPGGYGYTPPKPPETPQAVATLTPAEVVAAGFPEGSVVQRKPDGTLVKTFSPTERDANGGRALPANVVNDLSKDAEKLTTLTDLAGSFRPEFAGNVVGGNMENLAGRLGGERLGVTSKGQSEWWQQYDRLKNVVRNELFGAALTATEQAAFEAADITPNMDPSIVAANLRKQGEIVRRALDRKASVWKSQGYNPDAVINATTVNPGASSAPASPVTEMSDEELKKALNL